jgi:hypothetical protein
MGGTRTGDQGELSMKRVLGHVVAGLIGVGTAGAVISACAHDDSSIFILNVVAPVTATAGTTCVWNANPTQNYLPVGSLDAALGDIYTAVFLVGNQLVAQADPTVPRTETSIVNVQGAVVRITQADGTPITTFTSLTSGGIQAASGGTPSYAAVQVTVVDHATVLAVDPGPGSTAKVITYSKIFGKTLGGQYVESNEFEFPVTICHGCSIAFSQSDISPLCQEQPNCFGNSTATASTTTANAPCFAGQDGTTDCSLCRASVPPIPECNPPCTPIPVVVDAGTD